MKSVFIYLITFLFLFSLSDTLYSQCLSGTTISVSDGSMNIAICTDEETPERVFVRPSTYATRYAYLITDANNVIVEVSNSPILNLSSLPSGDFRIWGLSYGGVLLAQPGLDIDTARLTDFCFELSANFLTLARGFVNGGSVQTTDADTDVLACVGDGDPNVVTFETTGTSSGNYAYVITDENNVVLSIADGNSVDFEGTEAGVIRVWGLAYSGSLTVEPGDMLTEVMLSDACFELSENFVTVTRAAVNGGMVMMPNGGTQRLTCPSDGNPDIVRFDSTGVVTSGNFTYVITDAQNNILSFSSTDFVDFDGAGPGASRVYGLAYTGNLLAAAGNNLLTAILSDQCYDVSSNFIGVVRVIPNAGTIATTDGETMVTFCQNPSTVSFQVMGNTVIPPSAYVLTDENNVIVALSTNNQFDFSNRMGTFRVHGLSYTGTLTAEVGDDADEVALSDDCFDLSDNFVTVEVADVEGGTVMMPNGETERTVCVGDGNSDIVQFDSTSVSASASFTYIVTDENNVILSIPDGDRIDFNGADPGVCRVWGVSYTGSLTAIAGDVITDVELSDECFDLSENFIAVTRIELVGGSITLENGDSNITTCAGDGVNDFLTFSLSDNDPDAEFRLVLTDANNRVLFFYNPNDTVIDFTGIIPADYRIYSISYTGMFTGRTEVNLANAVLSDQCYSITENFVAINALNINGGMVMMPNGETERTVCVGDGEPDIVRFDSTGVTTGVNFTYVVTDENNIILAVPAGDQVDFDGAEEGICRVWGLAYTGELTAMVGDTASAVMLSNGCFELSSNFITVTRVAVEGGIVSTESSETTISVCSGDGAADDIAFEITGNTEDANFTFVVTDENNVILSVPDGNVIDFESAGAGICRVWGLTYTGDLTAMVGDTASATALSDGCFALSDNFITVERTELDGGMVSTVEDEIEVSVCVGDGITDEISFQSTAIVNNNYTFLVTDTNNVIISLPAGNVIDFDNAGSGTFRVYGLAYTGEIAASVGDTANLVALSDDCYLLSENFVTVNAFQPEAGRVMLISGSTDTTIIVDGNPDLLQFMTTADTTGFSFTYVVTDANNTIIAIPSGNIIDFEGSDIGVCRLWGLVYSGNLTTTVGNPFGGMLADECFARSENFVTIRKNEEPPCLADAGTITADNATVTLDSTTVTISATPNGDQFVPNGYEVLYVLTSGTDLVIEAVNNIPAFEVSDTGRYTIHTLVAELSNTSDADYLDLSVVEFGVTTGADVLDLIAQNELCADLDATGAAINVGEPDEVCLADAGSIQADDATVVLEGNTVTISATPAGDQVVPNGYEVLYILTSQNDLVIEAINEEPTFEVDSIGLYRIHTLVAELSDTSDVNYLDTALINVGVTTGIELVALIIQSEVCADLDEVGAPISVIEPLPCLADAGTLTAVDSTVFLFRDSVLISATPNGDRAVPVGFEVIYVLTSGADLVIEAVSTTPSFAVADTGLYTIHTLVAETTDATSSDYLDLSVIELGTTTGADVVGLIMDSGICADLDAVGAPIQVATPLPCLAEAGALVPEMDTAVFVPGMVLTVNATPQGFNIPTGYEIRYFIFRNGALIAPLPQDSPNINIGNSGLVGTFSIHTVVAELSDSTDINFLDLSSFLSANEPITLEEAIAFFNQIDVCADFAEEGATIEVVLEPEPCLVDAGTLRTASDTVLLNMDTITISATPNPDRVVPPGYEFRYVLTSGTGLVIEAVSTTPNFEVSDTGLYTIHTLVAELTDTADANYLDLSVVEFGTTTGVDVVSLINSSGICADLDAVGASITVVLPPDCLADAGSLRTENSTVTLRDSTVVLVAESNDDTVVPDDYEVIYVLTSGTNLVLEAVDTMPIFTVADTGLYTIHTLVAELTDTADANYLDLSVVEFGTTTGGDVLALISDNGICADLDATGVQIEVVPPVVLTPAKVFLIGGSTDTTVCIDGSADKLTFGTTAADTVNFSYIVTDTSNNILRILPGNMNDFDPAGAGICRTWGLSYLGDLTVSDMIFNETFDQDSVGVGGDCPDSLLVNCDFYNLPPANGQWTITTAADADSVFLNDEDYFKVVNGALEARDINDEFCFVSSPIDISGRERVDFTAEIMEIGDLEDLDYVDVTLVVDTVEIPITNFFGLGNSERTLTGDRPDDDDFGSVFVTMYGISGDSLRIRICVKNDAAAEQIRIDNITVSECTVCGQNATEVDFADGAYTLSSNFVTINRTEIDGGMVTLLSGSTDTTVIVSDGLSDKLTFVTTADTTATSFTYVVTDENNIILAIPTGNMIDFDGAGVGICRVWGLSYTGSVIAMEGENAAEVALADGCFALSDNFVTVVRAEVIDCEADAGTIDPTAGTYTLGAGLATISAVSVGDTIVPDGYEVLYVLTSGTDLIIEDVNDAPVFIVDTTGLFTIHTLVAELDDTENPDYLDLSVIEFGVTPASDVVNLIATSGICADLDAEGASMNVEPESTICIANAGSLTAVQTPINLVGSGVRIAAVPNGDAEVGGGFEVRYILTMGGNQVIQAIGTQPNFVVTTPGQYTIHTLVAELNDTRSTDFLDLSSVELGTTTALEVFELLISSGVCADLDVTGASITVEAEACLADAGTLSAPQDTVQIVNGLANVSASPNGDAFVPAGYERVYFLTQGEDLTFIRINAFSPTFSVMNPGTYTVHTLVAELSNPSDPNYLNPNNFMLGSTTAEDILIFFDTTSICASLDINGVTIIVTEEGGANLNEDTANATLTLGPNPATDVLNVTLENHELFEATETVLLNVYNLNGQLVHSERISVHQGLNQYQLQVFDLQSGMYLVRIQGEEHTVNDRFIRTRL